MPSPSRCRPVPPFVVLAFALALVAARPFAAGQAPSLPEAGPLTVMSFNIRLGTANDGDNHWTRRRDMLFDLLRRQDADLIGVQEAFRFQIDEILAAVPGYAVVGVARDDGRAAGEASAILFRTRRFHVSHTGTFWFSDTPDVPGTRTWGNRYNRISTWARFVDRDGSAFWHYNLHLDHEVQVSREKSTELLMQRIGTRPFAAEPVIITGDFNAGEDNVAVHRLIGAPGAAQTGLPPFVDTFRVLHPGEKVAGTFNSWTGVTDGPKIDYVLVQPGVRVLSASILRDNRDGRYPSDHYPVVARVQLSTTR
jgi:endonuclease/exonuclease/phosphatase family metal-dependent hydrolase